MYDGGLSGMADFAGVKKNISFGVRLRLHVCSGHINRSKAGVCTWRASCEKELPSHQSSSTSDPEGFTF